MASANTDTARTYFQAVQTGDMAALGELLDADIVGTSPAPTSSPANTRDRPPSSRCSAA